MTCVLCISMHVCSLHIRIVCDVYVDMHYMQFISRLHVIVIRYSQLCYGHWLTEIMCQRGRINTLAIESLQQTSYIVLFVYSYGYYACIILSSLAQLYQLASQLAALYVIVYLATVLYLYTIASFCISAKQVNI